MITERQNTRVFVTYHFTTTEKADDSKTTDQSHAAYCNNYLFFLFTSHTRRPSSVPLMGKKQCTQLNDAYFRITDKKKNNNNNDVDVNDIHYNIIMLSAAVQNVKHIKTSLRFIINATLKSCESRDY